MQNAYSNNNIPPRIYPNNRRKEFSEASGQNRTSNSNFSNSAVKICPQCSQKYDGNVAFCLNCGEPLIPYQQQYQGQQNTNQMQ